MDREQIMHKAIQLNYLCRNEPHVVMHKTNLLFTIYEYLFGDEKGLHNDCVQPIDEKKKEEEVYPDEEFIKTVEFYNQYRFAAPYSISILLNKSSGLASYAARREGRIWFLQPMRALTFIATNLNDAFPKYAKEARRILQEIESKKKENMLSCS